MSAGGGTSQNSEKAGATASLLRFIAIGTITGLGFGLVMAIVSNGFVLGVKALSSLREGQLSELLRFGDLPVSFAPVVSLLVAVAAIARDNTELLIFGLALAIAFMAFFASLIMRVMVRYRWLSYFGLLFLVYLAAAMLFDGFVELNSVLT